MSLPLALHPRPRVALPLHVRGEAPGKDAGIGYRIDIRELCLLSMSHHGLSPSLSLSLALSRVFTAASTQEDVFLREGTLAVECVLSGLPATILAYGTAGSGKSHTLFGPRENRGIGPQVVASLLKMIEDSTSADAAQPLMHVSCYEVYQNQVYDLLVGRHHEVQIGSKEELAKSADVFSKVEVKTMDQFWTLVNRLREVCVSLSAHSLSFVFVLSVRFCVFFPPYLTMRPPHSQSQIPHFSNTTPRPSPDPFPTQPPIPPTCSPPHPSGACGELRHAAGRQTDTESHYHDGLCHECQRPIS